MKEGPALDALAALANETRLRIVRLLVDAGRNGCAAGDIATKVGASSSRLSFHISVLEQAGLVSSERQSRNIIYRARPEQLGGLIAYLLNDCCGSHPAVCACFTTPKSTTETTGETPQF
jgi:ArsR family transcriptional regulator, arsenate/arsenite/antimonite-responsive transcriptional repressor